MSLQYYHRSYHYDNGLNLLQRGCKKAQSPGKMVVSRQSNRAIDELLYRSLDLTPSEKANLDQTFRDKGIFDTHGNQLKTETIDALTWDYRNMLQTTAQDHVDGTKTVEYNVYAAPGCRSKKITETSDKDGKIAEIEEVIYLNNLEYRSTWRGNELHYDGETVTGVDKEGETHTMLPKDASQTLRISDGHKRVAQVKTDTTNQSCQTHYHLDNHIDSCQMVMDTQGNLQSYLAYYPYGDTAISFGHTADRQYKFSGQEQDKSGLYYYGYRSYLPENFRWMNPDPMGIRGSGLNFYAYANANPITYIDLDGRISKNFAIQLTNEFITVSPVFQNIAKNGFSVKLEQGKEYEAYTDFKKKTIYINRTATIFDNPERFVEALANEGVNAFIMSQYATLTKNYIKKATRTMTNALSQDLNLKSIGMIMVRDATLGGMRIAREELNAILTTGKDVLNGMMTNSKLIANHYTVDDLKSRIDNTRKSMEELNEMMKKIKENKPMSSFSFNSHLQNNIDNAIKRVHKIGTNLVEKHNTGNQNTKKDINELNDMIKNIKTPEPVSTISLNDHQSNEETDKIKLEEKKKKYSAILTYDFHEMNTF